MIRVSGKTCRSRVSGSAFDEVSGLCHCSPRWLTSVTGRQREFRAARLLEEATCLEPSSENGDCFDARIVSSGRSGFSRVPKLLDIYSLFRADETGLDGSDGAKRGAGEDEIPGRIAAGVVQLSVSGILAPAILAIAVVRAVPDELETLLRAVPSPRNKHTWGHG